MVTTAAEPEIHGRIFGMLHLLWTFAMILGTLLGGALLEIDVRLPFVVVGVLNGIALILTVPFFRMEAVRSPTVLCGAVHVEPSTKVVTNIQTFYSQSPAARPVQI
jgi:MFS family permease